MSENKDRYCVIMCGGVGSRFWPMSRKDKPKQFLDFLGTGRTLLQMTVDRLKGLVPAENIILVTNESYAALIREQLPEVREEHLLLEPARRNTAPCNAWAAWHIAARNPNAKIMVAPSDHLVLNREAFAQSVENAFEFLDTHNQAMLTMGVKPSRPETGYGYIQVGEQVDSSFSSVKTFTEKPNEELAKVFLESGEFFWNSGMFFWTANTIKESIRAYAPDIAAVFDRAADVFATDAELQYINDNYASCPNISIDFAVMEKTPNAFVERVDIGWSDLGTWGSLYEVSPKNRDGNVTQNCKSLAFDSHNNVFAVKGDKLIVVSGLDNYIVADVDDALLIVPRSDESKIRTYVNEVKANLGDKYL